MATTMVAGKTKMLIFDITPHKYFPIIPSVAMLDWIADPAVNRAIMIDTDAMRNFDVSSSVTFMMPTAIPRTTSTATIIPPRFAGRNPAMSAMTIPIVNAVAPILPDFSSFFMCTPPLCRLLNFFKSRVILHFLVLNFSVLLLFWDNRPCEIRAKNQDFGTLELALLFKSPFRMRSMDLPGFEPGASPLRTERSGRSELQALQDTADNENISFQARIP